MPLFPAVTNLAFLCSHDWEHTTLEVEFLCVGIYYQGWVMAS